MHGRLELAVAGVTQARVDVSVLLSNRNRSLVSNVFTTNPKSVGRQKHWMHLGELVVDRAEDDLHLGVLRQQILKACSCWKGNHKR